MGAGSTSAVKINEGKEVGEAAIKAINLVGAERAMKVGRMGLGQHLCRAVGWTLMVKERRVVGEGFYVALPVVGGQCKVAIKASFYC